MFNVLVFVYENYWRGDALPQAPQLERKLNAHGFEAGDIHDALAWLDGLNIAAENTCVPDEAQDAAAALVPSKHSMRIYSAAEQHHLGARCLGFIAFLESSGVLPAAMREIVLDRAMAVQDGPVRFDDLKIIVLMVYWRFGREPDALVLDELCEDTSDRIAH